MVKLWSCVAEHSCWIMNFIPNSMHGSITPFGCPVYAYVRSQALNPPKGSSRVEDDYLLGKDRWTRCVGMDQMVKRSMLARSVRRVDRPWTRFSCLLRGIFPSTVGISDQLWRTHSAYEEGSWSPSIGAWTNARNGGLDKKLKTMQSLIKKEQKL